MKRFFQDDPDEQNFLSSEDGHDHTEAEFTAFINTEEFMSVMSMDLAQMQLNQQLLIVATELARKGDWLWWFRSPDSQGDRIEKMYIKLLEISEKVAQMTHEAEQGEQDGVL